MSETPTHTNLQTPTEQQPINYLRGALFAIPGPIIGIILWVVIWEMGFIASLATFALAWLTIWLYQKGAGGVDRKSLYIILPYIGIGIILSLLAGIADDLLSFVLEDSKEAREAGTLNILTSSDFWSMFFNNIFHNSQLWG